MPAENSSDIEAARDEPVRVLDGAERENEDAAEPGGLVKVGAKGLSIELRLDGHTIALDGNDVSHVPADGFRAFVERQKPAIEGGDADDAIGRALAEPGTGKAPVRVRAIGSDDGNA